MGRSPSHGHVVGLRPTAVNSETPTLLFRPVTRDSLKEEELNMELLQQSCSGVYPGGSSLRCSNALWAASMHFEPVALLTWVAQASGG